MGRLTGTWGLKFPRATFKFVIRHGRITLNRRTIKLRPSKNKKFPGWFTFPYRRVTYYIRFTPRGVRVVTLKGKKVVTGRVVSRPKIVIVAAILSYLYTENHQNDKI